MLETARLFLDQTAPGIEGLHPYVPGKPIAELERELGISNTIKLASNENPLGPSPLGQAAARNAAADINIYPDDLGFRLRNSLASRFGIGFDQTILGRGSSEILDMVARTFLYPGVNAVFSAHAFAMYPIFTQATGADCKVAPALPATDPVMPYGHDLDAMLDAIDDNTHVVFIANPNNPTGTWLQQDALYRFINQIPGHVVIVLDEAYAEYVEEADYPNGLLWLSEFPNLLITRTFSKIYGLAGLRIGWAAGSRELLSVLNRVRNPFHVNNIALAAAEAALDDGQFLLQSLVTNRDGLRQLQSGIESLGLSSLPSVGNFLCVRVADNGRDIYDKLLGHGVIVRPVDNYGLPEYLRITVGSKEQNQLVLNALKVVLEK